MRLRHFFNDHVGSLALSEDSYEIPDLNVSESGDTKSGAETNCDALAVMLYKAKAGTVTKSPNTTRKNSESRSNSNVSSTQPARSESGNSVRAPPPETEALHAWNAGGGAHLDLNGPA